MNKRECILVGAPVDSGKARNGCLMGPDAYRTAEIGETLAALGHKVTDAGNVTPRSPDLSERADVHALAETIGWTEELSDAAYDAARKGLPIFLGGDHALSLGTVAGISRFAQDQERPLFVLWMDAHSDIHTPKTTTSGNLHGTPVGYLTGATGFDEFPAFPAPVPTDQVCLFGIRSVDQAEHARLADLNMNVIDMRAIDEMGIAKPLNSFLEKVARANGLLHVSLDVDFLDPSIAPAVGTTVPGGATFREAHLAMEILYDSGLVTSLDLVELNPFLDVRATTANLMVDLTASLLGRKVFDRPTPVFT